jgi:hypothetical protein
VIPDLQSERDEPGGKGLAMALFLGIALWALLASLGLAVFVVAVALGYGR